MLVQQLGEMSGWQLTKRNKAGAIRLRLYIQRQNRLPSNTVLQIRAPYDQPRSDGILELREALIKSRKGHVPCG